MHMMGRDGLAVPGITFLVLRDTAGQPVGMGALKKLGDGTAELKSMHVLAEARGTGAARQILESLIDAARQMNARAIYLETGAQPSFTPARMLYYRSGFTDCAPFANYAEDPNSAFMVLQLDG